MGAPGSLPSSHFSRTCASLYSPSCQDALRSAFSSPSFSCMFSVGGLSGLQLSSAPMRSLCSSNPALNKSWFSALSVKLQFSALLGYMNTAPTWKSPNPGLARRLFLCNTPAQLLSPAILLPVQMGTDLAPEHCCKHKHAASNITPGQSYFATCGISKQYHLSVSQCWEK